MTKLLNEMSHRMKKTQQFGFQTRSDTNQAVQSKKIANSFKF